MTTARYLDAAGLRTYVMELGSGDPVLLLHGGLETVDDLPDLTRVLSRDFRVIAPERRGHGRTPDVSGPVTYEAMADDTLSVMDALAVQRAHFVGYSDGANIAMLIAIHHPLRISRLVLASGNFHHAGMTRAFRKHIRRTAAHPAFDSVPESYARLSPDGPDHWWVVSQKVQRMWRGQPRLGRRDLRRITAPTLVLAGDEDYVSVRHSEEMAKAIPGSQLRIIPGDSHGLLREEPMVTTSLIREFLVARTAA